MSAKKRFVGAGIALCALLICIGAVLVISTAMANPGSDDVSSDNPIQETNANAASEVAETSMENASGAAGTEAAQTQESASQTADASASSAHPEPTGALAPASIASNDGASSNSGPEKGALNEQNEGVSQSNGSTPSSPASTCTISIDCSAALANSNQLSAGIAEALPANGLILAPSAVELAEKATAFDVLKSACSVANIPLDYSGGFLGSSMYVRSIGPIGEFDCGSQSGWTYTVNNQMVFTSASDYVLKPGDVLCWTYTCEL